MTKVFTAEQFGAVGDGKTDDTVAVQAAIDAALAAGDAEVCLGLGKAYRIEGLQLKENPDWVLPIRPSSKTE